MKKDTTLRNKMPIKTAFRMLSFIFAAILLSACSKKVVFPVSQVVPAARAELKMDKDDNKNYNLDLEVENLAESSRLTPSRNHYVVWLVTKKHGTINIGSLNVGKKNKASLETMTPYEPVRVFITAEDDQKPVLPSTQVVLDSGEFDL